MNDKANFAVEIKNHVAWLTLNRPEKRNVMGLITRICDDLAGLYEEAEHLANQIAACPPLTVQGTKEVINYSRDNGIEAGLQYVAQKNAAALPSEDLFEAVAAFMEKRAPVFKGK